MPVDPLVGRTSLESLDSMLDRDCHYSVKEQVLHDSDLHDI